ncbi:MAG: neutral zinc metallopeptidase [Alphaproteobacteria bacterium]
MRWQEGRRSTNIEDMRGLGGGYGGLGGLPIGIGGMRGAGLGGFGLFAFVIIAVIAGIDPTQIIAPGGGSFAPSAPSANEAQLEQFVAVVLADTEDVWHQQFSAMGRQYVEPKLVLFRGGIESGCGFAETAVGPFYCPGDQKVYLDLSFLDDLATQLGAPGDFAEAYVISHEVGHHVQKLLGIMDRAQGSRAPAKGASGASVRTELQADCFAGIWAHYADKTLGVVEPGDIDEALNAAAAVGDDRLEQEAQGRVVPDSFTHGTSEQRARWFKRGYDSGEISQCDTFRGRPL